MIDLGPSYEPLLGGTHADRFVLVEGPRGTGKTRAILTVLVLGAMRHPGSRIMLARSTRTRLSQSVLVTLEDQVLPSLGMPVPGGAGRENRSHYDLPGGSMIIPMGLDDLQRTQSAEYSQVYVAEGVEIHSRDQVLALAGSLRQAGGMKKQCIVDCNPGPPGHWLNQIAEPVPKDLRRVTCLADYRRVVEHNRAPSSKGWKRIISRIQDNPAYFDLGQYSHTPAGQEYMDTLSNLTGHLRRRWLDGDWVAAEGTVFPEFDDSRHVLSPFAVPSHWPIYVGIDPGYDHPCAILWFAVAPNGCIYIIDELYRGGMSVAQHARDIQLRNEGRTIVQYLADPQDAFKSVMQNPKSIARQFADCGISVQRWPRSTEKQAMVEAVRDMLLRGKLKIFSSCSNTVNEFQSWSFKRRVSDPGNPPPGDDAYEDANNHALDVVCGVIARKIHLPRQAVAVYG